MILWSASLLLFCTRGQQMEAFQKRVILIMPWSSLPLSYLHVIKRVKRKGNYQVCENNTSVCLRLCTRRQQVEASVAGEAAARLVLSNTPLKWTPTVGSDHIAYCNIICGTIGSLTHLSSGCWFSSRLLVQPLL